jgi:chromosome segregation ATPase
MPETDIERTLKDIRERVRVQLRQQAPSSIAHPAESDEMRVNGAAIESIRANLSVIERSRTRLPPITSYRRGWASRGELWIKRLLKRASHWFTWEQVNFNSATSNSLKDVLVVLSSHEEDLVELQAQLQKITSTTTKIQMELEAFPANGHQSGNSLHEDRPERITGRVAALVDNLATAREQKAEIDSEMESLAARLEELRAIKAQLEDLG